MTSFSVHQSMPGACHTLFWFCSAACTCMCFFLFNPLRRHLPCSPAAPSSLFLAGSPVLPPFLALTPSSRLW
eukprot:m.3793 g.3793  ORF g.3793 m.3793 type:complete len:72 (-) comp2352_c0_seq1:101-316(-)